MKAFNRIFLLVITAILAVFIGTNVWILTDKGESGRPYRVEISRLVQEMEEGSVPDISSCTYVTAVSEYGDDFYTSESDYVIHEINGSLYRFDYKINQNDKTSVLIRMNLVLGVMAALMFSVMLCIKDMTKQFFTKFSFLLSTFVIVLIGRYYVTNYSLAKVMDQKHIKNFLLIV